MATFNTAQTATEDGAAVNGTLTATDADVGDVLTFTIDNPIDGLTLAGDTFSFDPTHASYQVLAAGEDQVITVDYTVTDSQGATGTNSFTITVTGVNDDPVATFNTQQDVNEGDAVINGQLTSTDVDNNESATYADTTAGIAGLTIMPNGSFSFDPSDVAYEGLAVGDTQTETVTYSVTDAQGAIANGSFDIVISGSNDAPTLVPPTPADGDSLQIVEGNVLSFTITGQDSDTTDVLTYSVSNEIPPGSTLNANTGVFEWTPTYEQAGTYNLTLTVTDPHNESASVSISIDASFLDNDNDTLPDTWETANGLDPTSDDSDGDTIPDIVEVGGDINSPLDSDNLLPIDAGDNDSDDDGIPDQAEAGDADPLTAPIDSDGDGIPNYRDTDSDNDNVLDGAEDLNNDGIVDANETDPRNPDTDGDAVNDDIDNCPLVSNANQIDFNGDGAGDLCGDIDGDTITDDVDNCINVANPGQEDYDGTGGGDACDDDDDNDGVLDVSDNEPLNEFACSDTDNDTCDDCSNGTFDVANDGVDFDTDGLCDDGDDDDDNDGALDADDSDDNDATVCSDTDNDLCDDCASGTFNTADDGLDADADGICDLGDLCVNVFDPAQVDTDGDGEGDECDCGDGVIAGVEECDDAGDSANCDIDCTFVVCGDGHINVAAGETCDDGNQTNGDLCPDGIGGTCQDSICGDGFVQEGLELCDDGNGDNTDDCPDGIGGTCQPSYCGDGFVNALTEACDDANDIETDGCTNVCEVPACGDGVLQGGEACDDGNLMNGDGCNDTCQTSDDILWIDITAGAYDRGNNADRYARPVKNVQMVDFKMMRSEVTVKQYRACVEAGACSMPGVTNYCNYNVPGRDWHPINCVSQVQAMEYAAYMDALDPAVHIRLPSEAEWEYAARSLGTEPVYPWGADPISCDFATFKEGGYGCGQVSTSPVCSQSTTQTPRFIPVPNGDTVQGLCDMVGNVSEWTLDVYRSSYNDSYTDSRMYPGFTSFEFMATNRIPLTRVLRGGSWIMTQSGLSVTKRHYATYSLGAVDQGIRLVSTLCGNGIVEGNEVCDDGNSELFDGCNFLCQEGDL